MRIKHYGSVDEKGKLILGNPDQFKSDIQKLKGKNRVYLVVDEDKPSRSTNQNKYYWSICLGMVSEFTGHTPEELHEYFKEMFLPHKQVLDKSIVMSSTKLKTDEFEKYLEDIRRFAAEKLNVVIPLPNEIITNEE